MALNIYLSLGIALFLGLLSSKIMKEVRLPNVTGYLIVGLITGPYCYPWKWWNSFQSYLTLH